MVQKQTASDYAAAHAAFEQRRSKAFMDKLIALLSNDGPIESFRRDLAAEHFHRACIDYAQGDRIGARFSAQHVECFGTIADMAQCVFGDKGARGAANIPVFVDRTFDYRHLPVLIDHLFGPQAREMGKIEHDTFVYGTN